MTLAEYRIFKSWFNYTARRGVFSFAFPQIDDNTGVIKEYRFAPNSKPSLGNPSGDILEVSMVWEEVL
jgi:hypothetical protein